MMAMFTRNKSDVLRRYVTKDETWIHHSTSESKRSLSEWSAAGEAQQSAGKAKLHELHFELLPHPPYSPDLAPSDYWLFADLKKNARR